MAEVARASVGNAAALPSSMPSAGQSFAPSAHVSTASLAPNGKQLQARSTTNATASANADSKATAAGAVAHILTLGQLDVDRRLDFLTTNRVVAVLEKAVERLQLLSLLDAAGSSETETKRAPEDDDGGEGPAAASTLGGEQSMSKTQKILARFAVDTSSSRAATAAQHHHAIIQEALLASTATARPAATFAGLDADGDSSPLSRAQTRKTAAQVTAALAEASQVSRRGRATVAEMLEEQQRLEVRYGQLLRAAQELNQPPAHAFAASSSPSAAVAVDRTMQPYFTHVRDAERQAIQHELKTVSQRLREHNKHLCTQLKDAPNDGDNWRKISNERKELIALLKQTIEELTAGYAESRRNQYQGTGALDGSFRSAGGLRKVDSKASLLSGAGSRRCSNQSEGFDSHSQSAVSSQQPGGANTLMKRFGSTMQMRRLMKPTVNHPRIPLFSSYAQFARKILQEDAAQRWADDLVRKERELNQNVKQLQSDLTLERNKKEREVAERGERIHALQVQLRELKRELKQRSDEAKVRAEAASEGLQRKAHEAESELEDRSTHVQHELTVEQRTHELFARHLRERAAATDALAADWQRKNPGEIKRTELKKMDAEQTRQQCAERLEGCEREVQQQQMLKEERDRATAQEAAAAQAVEAQRQAVYAAASKLQSAVRAMLTRDAVSKQMKKGGKKKKRASKAA